jgi:hypothetical protein
MIQIKGFAVKKSKIIVKIKYYFCTILQKGVTGALVFDCRRTSQTHLFVKKTRQ